MTIMAVDLSVLLLSLMASHTIHISDSILRCSPSIVASFISAVMQSGMSMHDSMAFMVTFIPSISVCLMVMSGQPICYEQM